MSIEVIEVIDGGLATTVQDGGRPGWAALGVGTGGAADGWSLAIANRLVGNPASTAALEITLRGPSLRLQRAARIALTGASIDARCADTRLPMWRWIDLPEGAALKLGGCRDGARSYLAIDGGIAVPEVLGSCSTDLRNAFGGIEGQVLRAGDSLPLGNALHAAASSVRIDPRWIDPRPDLDLERPCELRVLPGDDRLTDADDLTSAAWQVDQRSNRQGLRLQGKPLTLAERSERISEPVTPGTLQLPPDGQPIVLGIDAQTVGGYPRIGHVIRADWPRLGQLRPGDPLAFRWVDPATAWALWQAQRASLARIGLAIEAAQRRSTSR